MTTKTIQHTRRQFLKTGALSTFGLMSLSTTGRALVRPVLSSDQELANIRWFKESFAKQSANRLLNTPFTIDFLAAVALQETGYFWTSLRGKGLSTEEILELCVGDTLDYPSRSESAFPRNKTELVGETNGQEMFEVARGALQKIGEFQPAYKRVFEKYPDKFCHGFGIFQYDLQFFLNNPEFFLEKKWTDFDECLRLFVEDELINAQRAAGFADKPSLTHEELVYVAIAYNRGRVEKERGFKQGHKNPSTGKYYGEYISEYLALAGQVVLDTESRS